MDTAATLTHDINDTVRIPEAAWHTPPRNLHLGWRYVLNLTHLVAQYDTNNDFPTFRDQVVKRIHKMPDHPTQSDWDHPDWNWSGPRDDLQNIGEEFAETTSIAEFDEALSYLYDWADDNRVWIRLH